MTGVGFEFSIEVRHEGALVGSEAASLTVCLEDALFRGALAGHIPNDGRVPPFSIAPEWEDEGPATVTGLELCLGDAPAVRYDVGVLAPQARALILALVENRKLAAGARVEWQVVAREGRPRSARFSARASRAPLPLERATLAGAARGELSVAIEAGVLRGIREQVTRAGTVERAWLLLGRLLHDAEGGAGRLEVTDLVDVAVGRGGASALHFAFQPSAFVAAKRAAERRPDALIPVGWGHSHPSCAACVDNPTCAADTVFFSPADTEVHTSAFASAYMVALVVGKVRHRPATRPGFRLYGWRGGQVEERPFRVCRPGAADFPDEDRALEGEVDR